jgi:hypothetical protein
VSRRYVVNRAESFEAAKRIRETFQDAPMRRQTPVPWQWPSSMQEVGICIGVMYASNKWQSNPRTLVDYKHLAEGPQRLYVRRGFLREHKTPERQLRVCGPMVPLDKPMPTAFAELAKILGIQAQLYQGTNERFVVPEGDEHIYQVNIPRAHLGAAKHPKTGETFLLVYNADGVHCIICGDELDVEKDGIVG